MNSPDNSRSMTYRDEMQYAERKGNTPLWHFYNANLALDEVKQGVNGGFYGVEGPSEADFDHVAHRFEMAIAATEDAEDVQLFFSARIVKAYIKPIAFADVLNMDILRGAAAKRAYENTGLDTAIDEAYEIASDALVVYEKLRAIPRDERSAADEEKFNHMTGFLGEITPLLFFGGRHRTSKWFATPALAYDDRLAPDKTHHIDVDLYDNRVNRQKAHHRIQVKTSISEFSKSYDPKIAVLYAHDFGNDAHPHYWSGREPFTSLRALLLENEGLLPQEGISQLNRIASKAFIMANTPRGARLMAAGIYGAHQHGKELGRLVAAIDKMPNKTSDEAIIARQALANLLNP